MNAILKFAASVFLSLWAVGVMAAHADTITVTTASDTVAVDNQCSFSEAITAANTDAAYQGCTAGSGADTIVFGVTGVVTVSTAPPTVTTPISVNGIGTTMLLTPTSHFGKATELAIGSDGALTLTNVVIAGWSCRLWVDGGQLVLQSSAISYCGGAPSTHINSSRHGAVVNHGGRLYVRDTVFSDNGSYMGGAITNQYGGRTHIDRSTFRANYSRTAPAILNGNVFTPLPADFTSTIWVTNSLFVNNATGSGSWYGRSIVTNVGTATLVGNLFSENYSTSGFADDAGVIWSEGVLTVTGNTFQRNVNGYIPESGPPVEYGFPDRTFAAVFARASLFAELRASNRIDHNTFAEGTGIVANFSTFVAENTITLPVTLTLENNTFVNAGKVITDRAQIEVYTNTTLLANANVIIDTTIGKDCLLMGGVITDLGRNIASDASCAYGSAGSQNSTDPLLGPLANNDGIKVGAGNDSAFLLTYKPRDGSPACPNLPCAGAVAAPAAPQNRKVYLPLNRRSQ